MAAISRRHFQNAFPQMKMNFDEDFTGFGPKGPINNTPALVQIMAWCRPGGKPLSEPMMVSLLTDAYMSHPASMS